MAPVWKNIYKVDFETVLGKSNNRKEVEVQIRIFKQILAKKPPKIWLDFFKELQKKSYQFTNLNEEYRIYQLPNNPELVVLIVRNECLKKYIMNAEYHNILIPNKDISKVKKHLKKSGFLIEFD